MKVCVKCWGKLVDRQGRRCKYCAWRRLEYPLMPVEGSGCYFDAVSECGLSGADAESAAVTCHVDHGGKLRNFNGRLVLDDRVP